MKKIILTQKQIDTIFSMHADGYGYQTIADVTGITINIVRDRLGKTKERPVKSLPREVIKSFKKESCTVPPVHINKYDYLLYERINTGKSYKDYLFDAGNKLWTTTK